MYAERANDIRMNGIRSVTDASTVSVTEAERHNTVLMNGIVAHS